jgi:hypothetical protein
MKLHEDFWMLSISIEKDMGGLFGYLNYPFETLEPEV